MFRVTYEIVTPESAIEGDAAERGFIDQRGFHYSLDDIRCQHDEFDMSLREAARLINAGALEDCDRWFAEVDGRQNYQTGAEERRSLHPPSNITAASYERLRRLLGFRS